MRRLGLGLLVCLGLGLSACATPEPTCRPVSPTEHAFFARIVAHDEPGVAALMSPQGQTTAEALRREDPRLAQQVFGQRMGDRSVRTVLMRPPLCIYDAPAAEGRQTRYVFANGRFDALQNIEREGVELGVPGADHAACQFVDNNGVWMPSDACQATFNNRPATSS